MAKKPSITTISSGYASTTALNDNFEALKEAFENTLSRDGSTPNTMGADLDMNGNDIVGAGSILVGGVDYLAQSLAYKNAAETAKTAAEAAKVAAELAYDNFDDRYLGAKTSDPSTDNDGNALLDGALFFDTTLNVMKVYDSGNTLWKRTTPTTSEQANIDTVSGISSDVTTVAGNNTNVTTVADNIADVNSVATNMAEVLTADTNAATATTKAAEASASATAAANSATSASTSATTASNQATAAATSASNAATSESNASTSAANAATSATSASGSASTATTQASNAASSASAASTSETNSANSAAASATSASNAAASATAANSSQVAATQSATLASTKASEASTSASDAATSATAAAASYDSFDDRYLGVKTTAPTTDNDGDALTTGCLYYNSTIGQLYIWDGSAWDDAALSASGAVTAFNTRTGSVTLNSTDVANASGLLTTGGTMTGNLTFGDNDKAIFGAGSDLQIYHDGTHSFINDTGTGDLYIRGSNAIRLQSNSGETYFIGELNGSVYLRYDDANKLATTATGIDVTGTVNIDSTSFDPASGWSASQNTSPAGLNFEDNGTTVGSLLGQTYKTDSVSWGTTRLSGFFGMEKTNAIGNGDFVWWLAPTNYAQNPAQKMRIASNGDISFYEDTGTTPKFFWDASAESLGIGTSSVDLTASGRTVVQVEGSSNALVNITDGTSRLYLHQKGGTNGADIWNSANSYMRFATNDTERMRIDSSGRVGIGTSSPLALLDIASGVNTTQVRIRNTSTGTASMLFQDSTSGTTTGDGLYVGRSTGVNYLWTYESEPLVLATNNTERMRIDSSGNVGIGVTPARQVHMHNASGDNNFHITNSTTGSTATDGFSIVSQSTTNDVLFNQRETANMRFFTANDEKMRIDSSGNLLVGGTSAEALGSTTLYNTGQIVSRVDGTYAAEFRRDTSDGSIVNFRKDGTAVGSIGVEGGDVTIGKAGSGLQFRSADPCVRPHNMTTNSPSDAAVDLGRSNTRFKDGHFSGTVNAANFNTTSDATLKTNVETLTGSLDAVKALRGVSFDWIESGNSEVGVIAQEVEAVVPDVVSTDDQGIKSVKYGNLVGVLIEAIKEQQAQIDELKAKLGD